jgi:phosphatidylinositol alpha 1,6-mannosyltransferase
MNILIVSELYYQPVGGVISFVRRLSHDLVAAGHQVTMCVAGAGAGARYRRTSEEGMTIYQMPTVPGVLLTGQQVVTRPSKHLISKMFDEVKPDVVHVNSPLIAMAYSVVRVAKDRSCPIVFTNHVMAENIFMNATLMKPIAKPSAKVFWRVTLNVANKANFVTSPSETGLTYLKENGLKVPARVITNGVDSEFYCPGQAERSLLASFNIPQGKDYLIHVGRLDGEKRVDVLITAMPAIRKACPNAYLLLAGTGMFQSELEAQVVELGLADCVQFLGFVSDEQKKALLQMSDLFVIASPAELQCIAGLEALACGLPVVAADQAALLDLCADDSHGRLFKFPSAASLAKEVNILLADKKLLEVLCKNARQFIVEHHSAAACRDKFLEIYKQAMAE